MIRDDTAPDHPVVRRRVLVVGATGRLGVAISTALVSRGDGVVLAGRDPLKLNLLARDLARASFVPNESVPTISQNLLDDDAPREIAARVVALGGVSDVVLACGPFPRAPVEQLTREDFESTLRVHAIAPLLLVNELAAMLGAREGAVVALTDAGVARPYSNHVAYLTAKGALQTGLRALSVELSPRVRVNCITLGSVSDPDAEGDPLQIHRLATRSPLGRFGTPADVVHVVLAMLDAKWATGENWGVGR